MRVSAKLQMDSHIPTDYGPPTPIVNFDEPPTPAGSMPEEVFDAKTGIFVKPEAEPETLGMISHKKSLLTIFGQKHEIKNFIKKFDIEISMAFDFSSHLESNCQFEAKLHKKL